MNLEMGAHEVVGKSLQPKQLESNRAQVNTSVKANSTKTFSEGLMESNYSVRATDFLSKVQDVSTHTLKKSWSQVLEIVSSYRATSFCWA